MPGRRHRWPCKLAAGVFTPEPARLGLEIGGSETRAWAKSDDAAGRPSLAYLNGRQTAIAAGPSVIRWR
ncbi:MAG: hypothetical protein ABW122_13890 [Ilumatobacteraceae bacterium]